jgi:cystathionine beta-lyase
VRLDALETSTLQIANWLAKHPLIEKVLHPALPTCPGHEIWKRDFSGSSSVFSFVFKNYISVAQAETFINSLEVFRIGMSWGGVHSLAVIYPDLLRPNKDFGGEIVRLNIGLEQTDDLISDLSQALQKTTPK